MDIAGSQPQSEAEEILEALRQVQENAALRAEASSNPESVLNRLKLSGVARHAVALGIASLLIVPTMAYSDVFWG
jgi:hypothetical protein